MTGQIGPTPRLKAFFEKKYGKQLSDIEVANHVKELCEFFSILISIDRRVRQEGAHATRTE